MTIIREKPKDAKPGEYFYYPVWGWVKQDKTRREALRDKDVRLGLAIMLPLFAMMLYILVMIAASILGLV